jgi:hypothetical protein
MKLLVTIGIMFEKFCGGLGHHINIAVWSYTAVIREKGEFRFHFKIVIQESGLCDSNTNASINL